MTTELKRCARCHSKVLLDFFDKNRQGEFKKCCKNCCRKKQQENTSAYDYDDLTAFGKSVIEYLDLDELAEERKAFIKLNVKDKGVKYIGKVKDTTQYNLKDGMPVPKEDVILTEFHQFEKDVSGNKIPVFVRWHRRASELYAKVNIKPVSLKFTLIKHKDEPQLDKEP